MSEETPNNSEERLQRHAKERRAQGGDFALHPATRRMLQGEVARTFGAKKPAAKSGGRFAWLNSWSGRIAIGATAVVVITGSWIAWNGRLDQRAMQLARADMPMRKSALAGSEGSKGVVTAEKEFALAGEPAVRAELEKKDAPVATAARLLVAAPTARNDGDSGKIAADKLTAMDALAQNTVAIPFQEQGTAASFFNSEATVSLAPVAANYSIANTPENALTPESRRQQTFNYANAAGQTFTLADQAAGYSTDAYKNQAGQALGGALALANNDQKQLMEADVRSRGQAGPPPAMQSFGANALDSRTRFTGNAPAAPAPTTAPAAVNLARSEEFLTRNAESFRGALAASGAAAPAAEDAASSRFYRSNSDVNNETRSKALAPTGRSLAESSPVLNEFVIEQRGAAVRVVDGDGSVYDGTVETPPVAGFVPGLDRARGIEQDGLVREVIPGDKSETAPRHQELSFRAAGSNVTLRQTVVVNGRFSPGTEAGRAGRVMPAEAPSKVQDLAARRGGAPAVSNAFAGQYGAATNASPTIEGTVRIGATNQQWFRALRRGP